MKIERLLRSRLLTPLAGRVVVIVMILHALLLPALFFGLDRIIVDAHTELFVNAARSYTTRHINELQAGRAGTSDADLVRFLDEAILSGFVVYADIHGTRGIIHSQLSPDHLKSDPHPDDTTYGIGRDHIYYTSSNFKLETQSLVLKFGFDETPTDDGIREARTHMILALSIYLCTVIALALMLARHLARPLADLSRLSGRIAAGDFSQQLVIPSTIREFSDLSLALDTMRRELVGINAQLQRRIEEQTSLEARLRQKQRLETVGTLAGGIAHEFNNVLVPITLFTESALGALSAEHVARPRMERALAAACRARDLVSKILTFSGRIDPTPLQAMNIATAVDEGLRLFESLRPSNIELRTSIDPDTAWIRADSTSVVQIVLNLCSNAYHAIPDSGGCIEVGLRNTPSDADQSSCVELSIRDNGHGMDAATLERVFEPFFTTRTVGKGTGLGLSVVHGLVTAMGGTIRVQSEPGSGTSLRVLFPTIKEGLAHG